MHQVGKLTHNYQRVSVSDPANNERRNENETPPFRTTKHVDRQLVSSVIAWNHKREETKQMTTKYLNHHPQKLSMYLYLSLFYILENITLQNDYLTNVTLLTSSDILVGYIPLPSLPTAP